MVCEGKNSSTRAEFGVEFDSVPYGQTAVVARLQCALPHQNQAFQWFSNGDILGLLPLSDTPQGNSVALVWSVSDERSQELCAMAPDEFTQALQSACLLHGETALGAMTLSSERLRWPLIQAQARRWTGQMAGTHATQSWALAGDAAHAVHPLAGQGLNLGLADVAGATLGLLIGGLLAAPIGAWAAKHFPPKQMLILVGIVLTLTSGFGVWKAWG